MKAMACRLLALRTPLLTVPHPHPSILHAPPPTPRYLPFPVRLNRTSSICEFCYYHLRIQPCLTRRPHVCGRTSRENLDSGIKTVSSVTRNIDRKSTRLNSSHMSISYAVFCLKK